MSRKGKTNPPQVRPVNWVEQIEEMATRYQARIDMQKASINRLLKDGSYDAEMKALAEERDTLLACIMRVSRMPERSWDLGDPDSIRTAQSQGYNAALGTVRNLLKLDPLARANE
jgi:hypothetical protein